jgi:ubiquinol-cytochrome c reductase cytochrome b subunit
MYRIWFWVLVLDIIVLAWCGGAPAEEPYVRISQFATMYYFAHFLILLPIISAVEKPLPLPNSIAESVFKSDKSATSLAGAAQPAE